MIRTASRMDEQSAVVTWLPVYHDMGLIGTVLNAITLQIELAVMSPRTFLRDPRLWLTAIGTHRGTHTAAPNFAYGLCRKRIADPSGLDLSSMRVFICGAEPIVPETLETFAAHFAPTGLDPAALVPAYGLAEATLAVSFTPYGTGLHTEEVDATALQAEHAAREGLPGLGRLRIPSSGVAMPGLEVAVRDPDSGESLADRRVGEVVVRGPSVTPGYIHDAEATRASRTADGWLRTGDLGYLSAGHLFLCGRIKDVIIVRGRNMHAHDIEALASKMPDVRTGNVVAFGAPGPAERRRSSSSPKRGSPTTATQSRARCAATCTRRSASSSTRWSSCRRGRCRRRRRVSCAVSRPRRVGPPARSCPRSPAASACSASQ